MNAARSAATGYASDTVEGWLKQLGTARVQLNVDQNGNWDDSSIDFLAPLYDSKKAMLFTQLGFRAPDGRNTGNFGAGVRTFTGNWMYGANAFFDDDFSGKNRRVGIGAEAWTDYLKVSANTYSATTSWHQSRDFDDYNEKPADGFDIRTEGYLPSYAFIGAKLMYEKYYGDQVALFDTDHLQNNPSAVTIGLNYTPVPLVTMGVDYKRGQDSLDDTQFSVNFRYSIGQSWSEQISPAQVDIERSLAGSRYDLIERNNTIVIAYQKKSVNEQLANMVLLISKDGSPADGVTSNLATVQATTGSGAAAKNTVINWAVSGTAKLDASTTTTDDNGMASVNFTNTAAGPVTVTASSGNVSRQQNSSFVQSVSDISLNITQNDSMADGMAENAGLATVKDATGKPMAGVDISWNVDNSAKITNGDAKTDVNGQATAHYSSMLAGNTTLKATAGGKDASKVSVFVANAPAKLQVSMTTNNVPADNATPAVAQAVITDASGKPMANTSVTWSLSGSSTAVTKTPMTATTDSAGIATLNLTDTVAEGVTVNAAAGGKTGSTTATFVTVPVAAVAVSMVTDGAVADGTTPDVVQAVITDASGKPMANISVTWSLSGSSTAVTKTPMTATTDSAGIATLNLTHTVAESVTVNAAAGGKTGSTTATFVAVPVAAVAVSMVTDGAVADGTTPDVAQAVITDASGKPMANTSVTWSLSGSSTAVTKTPMTATTDSAGIATLNLTDTVAEGVTVNAAAGGKTGSTTATFIAVPVAAVAVSMVTDGVVADGSTPDVAQAVITDASGKPIANTSVTWSLSGGSAASPATVMTDVNGIATLNLTDTIAEVVTVNVAAGGIPGSTTATFIADVSTAKIDSLVITLDGSVADGQTANTAQVMVSDAHGNPLNNQLISWSADTSTVVFANSTNTDTRGKATVSYTDTASETVNVRARLANGANLSQPSVFNSVKASNIVVTFASNSGTGSKKSPVVLQAYVTSATGSKVEGAKVSWLAVNSWLACSNSGDYTDVNGISQLTCYTTSGFIQGEIINSTVAPEDTTDPSVPVTGSIKVNLAP